MLLKQIDTPAQNAKTELSGTLSEEWMQEFEKHPAEAIEWAFRTWRHDSPFMPLISGDSIAEPVGNRIAYDNFSGRIALIATKQ